MRWCRLLRKSDMIRADLNHLSVIPPGLLSDPHLEPPGVSRDPAVPIRHER
jgi:hypothetical protein